MLDEQQLAEPPEMREMTQSRWVMMRDWLTRRSPLIVLLRVYCQVYRRVTGAPLGRFSRITPQIYVGGQHWPHGVDAMRTHGIDTVVNLRESVDDLALAISLDHYLHLPTVDNTPISQDDLARGVTFIAERIAVGGVVYIHCGVGVGRAPTLTAAYLVSTGLDPDEAWKQIRKARPFIWPNRRQLAAVRLYASNQQSGGS
jgi:protein-tyrosine phosphatase